jgi:hypothetical protein
VLRLMTKLIPLISKIKVKINDWKQTHFAFDRNQTFNQLTYFFKFKLKIHFTGLTLKLENFCFVNRFHNWLPTEMDVSFYSPLPHSFNYQQIQQIPNPEDKFHMTLSQNKVKLNNFHFLTLFFLFFFTTRNRKHFASFYCSYHSLSLVGGECCSSKCWGFDLGKGKKGEKGYLTLKFNLRRKFYS